jgi:hypothetical protein
MLEIENTTLNELNQEQATQIASLKEQLEEVQARSSEVVNIRRRLVIDDD